MIRRIENAFAEDGKIIDKVLDNVFDEIGM